MAKHKIKEVYGGPYLAESEAIITESRKEKPNYDELIANWETISQGALAFIEKQKEGFEKPVGEFVENVKDHEPEEPEVPTVHLYASNAEVEPEKIEEVQEKIESDPDKSEEDALKELGL